MPALVGRTAGSAGAGRRCGTFLRWYGLAQQSRYWPRERRRSTASCARLRNGGSSPAELTANHHISHEVRASTHPYQLSRLSNSAHSIRWTHRAFIGIMLSFPSNGCSKRSVVKRSSSRWRLDEGGIRAPHPDERKGSIR